MRTAFFCVVGVPAAAILVALLAQGCKREPTPPVEPMPPSMDMTNPPVMDTNPPVVAPTNPPTGFEQTLPPVAPAGVTEYTVVKGDTFSSMAKQFGVSVKAIQEANPGVDPKRLKIGQKLVVPAPTASAASATMAAVSAPSAASPGDQVYVVKSGDTLTRIGTRFGTTAKVIRSANNLTTDKIKVGDKLRIPANASASAPAPVPAPMAPMEPAPMTPMPVPPAAPPAR